jgi:hypothetical protein
VDTEQGETYLRVLAEAELRHTLDLPREPDSGDQAPVASCLSRWRCVASALTAVGAVEAVVVDAIEHDLEAAFAVRHRLTMSLLRGRARSADRLLGTAQAAAPPHSRPLGPGAGPAESVQVMPIGRRLLVRLRDDTAEVCLISLTRTVDREIFAVTARVDDRPAERSFHHPFDQLEAVDEAGNSYRMSFAGPFREGGAEGWLTISRAVPPELGWLELHSGPDTPRLRVDITAPPTPAKVTMEPAEAAGAGERMLDSIAADLLATLGTPHRRKVSPDESVTALEETGVLAPGSPATSRLAELCRQGGFDGGSGLVDALMAGRVSPCELPDPWANVLACYRGGDQPTAREGIAVIAVALPESEEGVRFVVTGLTTHPDHTILAGIVLGLSGDHTHSHDCRCWIEWFPWWIRDNEGQWHVAAFERFMSRQPESATFCLCVVPPVPASVTGLDVIITGPSRRVRLRLPVGWMAADG